MRRCTPFQVLFGLTVTGLLVACGGAENTARLTTGNPVLVVDKNLRVELAGNESGRVEITRLRGTAPESPVGTESLGAIYTVKADTDVRLVMAAPDNPTADILLWDDVNQDWTFVALAQQTADEWTVQGDGTVGLFAVVDRTPGIITTVDGAAADRASKTDVLRMILLEGVVAHADGSLDVSGLATLNSEDDYLALPDVTVDEPALALLLSNDAAQKTHIAALQQVAADANGVAVAYGPVSGEQSEVLQAMIEAAAAALREEGKLLVVRLPVPSAAVEGWQIGEYDAVRIGAAADRVIADLPGGPGDLHAGGIAADYLDWLVRRIDRRKIIPAIAASSMDEWEGDSLAIPFDYALAPLGSIGLKLNQPGASLEPGTALTFGLAGQASNFSRDPATGLYGYDIFTGEGEHHIWLVTASVLRQRLDWLAGYGFGGVLAEGLLDSGASPGILDVVERFSVGQAAAGDDPLMIAWQVQDDGRQVLFSGQTLLDEPLVWTPGERGNYYISATLGRSSEVAMGDASVQVGAPSPTPIPPGQGTASGQTTQAGEVGSPTGQNFTVLEGMPAPVYPPGQASFGKFELGGQVNHLIRHPDMMRDSGMTWVKFQLTWQPGQDPATARELVARGREAGFKVLLSIVGSEKQPQDINVPSYLDFLRAIAYSGPEAIEVWNEPNYYFEWPQGQMNGGEYVRRMLAPAYNAIKSVNPNIMVISGAPLPTGAYYGEGGCSRQGYGCDDWLYIQQMAESGASNYMDCVGVHYNAGATAPSATTGHPADPGYQHYSWYYGGMLQLYAGTFGHPVCFTELGYLSKDGLGELPANFSWAGKTTVNDQAAWLAEAAQLSRESGLVRLMIVWNVDFFYWGPDDPKAGYAIVRPDSSCPACTTLGQVMP